MILLSAAEVVQQVLQHNAGGEHPPVWQSLSMMALYAIVGVLVAIAGYKLFDICTPGDLHKEILENRNVAAAIVGGAIIVGVCIVVAACILG